MTRGKPRQGLGPAPAGASFSSLFSQSVTLDGEGLYRRGSVSAAAQEHAQDLVTLVFGLAVATMGFNMLRVGVSESLPMILGFLALALSAMVIGAKAVSSAGLGRVMQD